MPLPDLQIAIFGGNEKDISSSLSAKNEFFLFNFYSSTMAKVKLLDIADDIEPLTPSGNIIT